ncbi:MAG: hypothetical protein QM820_53780 [Minicystis sp.]
MLDRRVRGRAVRLLSWIGVAFALLFMARPASAYPWMIRHSYQGCVPCHADPSGAGLLTEYGRAMGENVLRMRYGKPPPDEPPAVARFLFGVPTPEWLLLGGSVRNGYQFKKQVGGSGGAWSNRFLQMEADLRAQVTFSRFRASGTLGYMWEAGRTANITSRDEHNLSSREHWVGVDLGEDKQFLLRAGRINIPFGIRNDEHELFTRSTRVTRTNINESQQHGIALSYNGQIVRGEIMALLGNYQLNPDKFRERGYAGFVEFNVKEKLSLGVSSMVTYAKQDYLYQSPDTIRQVHGAFLRASPVEPLVILAEADALVTTTGKTSIATAGTSGGFVSTVQLDYEPIQGLHLIATGETLVQTSVVTTSTSPGVTAKSFAGWASALWFFAPHADLRFDFVAYSLMDGPVSIYLLPQLHVYL